MEENFDKRILDENEDDFIEPAKDEEIARRQIMDALLEDRENFSYVDFAKLVISYNLKHLNVEEGINFRSFYSPRNKDGSMICGLYLPLDNSIRYNLANKENAFLIISTLSHETMHKCQQDKNLTSKMLSGKEQDYYSASQTSENFYRLCGFDPKYAYILDKSENEAFNYGFDTAMEFASKALRHYDNDDEDFDESSLSESEQRKYGQIYKEYQTLYSQNMNHETTTDFSFSMLRRDIVKYTQNGIELFDINLQKAKDIEKQLSLLTEGQEVVAQILSEKQIGCITKLAIIASHIPQRSMISNLVDFSITSQSYNECLNALTSEHVPLTMFNAYKLFMQCDSKQQSKQKAMAHEETKEIGVTVSEIDELALAKLLVVTHGKNDAQDRINGVKEFNEQMELTAECGVTAAISIDTHKTLEEIGQHSSQPVYQTEEGMPLYGSKDVLDYVLDKHCSKNNIEINSPQYNQAKLEFTNNLACLICHFENPYPENEEYLDAISTFVKTPTFNQYDLEENFSERPTCFTEEANDLIEDSIKRINNNEEIQTEEESKQAKTDYLTSAIMAKIFGAKSLGSQNDLNEDDELPEE